MAETASTTRTTVTPKPQGNGVSTAPVPDRRAADVESQKHYGGQASNRVELIDAIAHLIGWKFNAIKYIFRAGTKEGVSFEEDMKKAQVYIEYGMRLHRGEPISESARTFKGTA